MYDGLNPVQELDGASPSNVTANLLTGLGTDEYFTRTDSSGSANFLTDALRSVVALTDSGGHINTSYTYEPFGDVTVTGSNANPYQFTGRDNDGLGLYCYRARYYSPTYQRFIAEDPMEFRSGDVDLYMYGKDAPVLYSDAYGLTVWACSRAVRGFPGIGNHEYLWNDQNNQSCANEGSSGSGDTQHPELGPPIDACRPIFGSAKHENDLMACCNTHDPFYMNRGPYIPFLNDCQNKTHECIQGKGFSDPGPPGGRLGTRIP